MAGKLHAKLAHQISMKKAKIVAKEMGNGMTFNDLVLGMMSQALKQHFNEHKDESKYVSVSFPFTFNQIPLNPKDYKFGNNFAALTCYLPLESDLKTGCLKVNKIMNG